MQHRAAANRNRMEHFLYCLGPLGLNSPPFTRRSSISLVLAGQALPFWGVRLSCSDSIMGSVSLGPEIWLSAVQTPAGGAIVSMKPMPAITGAWMREAKLTVSK